MTRVLCGHLPDPPDPRDFSFESSPLLGAAPVLTTDDVDLRQFFPPVVAQIASNCCGHATRDAAFATASFAFSPIAKPSAAFLYSVARLLVSPLEARPRLVDAGSYLRAMFHGMTRWGLIAEERWPEVPETTNAIPPDDCFREGENAVIGAYYRIADGPGSALAIRSALRRGFFPVFAMMVDQAYVDIGGGVYREHRGAALGGHAQVICGYSATLDAFLVKNSWGPGFGDGGFFWLASSFVERATYDKWVIQVTPEAVG